MSSTKTKLFAKQQWKPGTLVYPAPAIMVSCGNHPDNYNIITISWTGTICTDPPMCYISVRPNRHSYQLIKQSGEFVINLTNRALKRATDWCGVKSGKEFDKFKEMQLTPMEGKRVKAPIIAEAPINIECKVTQILELGTHHMFVAEVVNVQADEQYINPETGAFSMKAANLIAYSHGHYYALGEEIGKFGWSIQKKKNLP